MNRLVKRGVFLFLLLVVPAIAAAWFLYRSNTSSVFFRTIPVKKGDLLATISATGTVEPEEVVDIGAQVAGRIVSFGKDQAGKTIDYGSVVEAGMVLARIDDALYAADVARAKAQLEQSKAAVLRAEADLGQLQAKLFQTERDWNRAKKLGPSDALSQSDYDAAVSAYEVAKANVAVGKAAIVQAKESVSEAKANLVRAQQNLDYCTIASPVKGVIIDRRVNIGQTVVASLNAPSLFLLAKDLKRMQVWVSVNEADIGNIRPGQPATFTVDAYPNESFQGEVGKVRLNANMTQNVVNYTVEVITDNSSGKLLPYLTANVKFNLSRRHDVLIVPNAALRWEPKPDQIAPDSRKKSKAGKPSRPGAAAQKSQEEQGRGVLWTVEEAFVRSIPVKIGLNDGSMTEVVSDQLKEGIMVVIGERPRESADDSSSASPFMPKLFKGAGPRH
ncbi:MAG: efflux RND transporter periplasmic adaptor subunit [Deltaproteobacteria bacterium]|nr:efflux RND transporter periplasmic adaptor subunit [Deltaproteobacteria bacterium]